MMHGLTIQGARDNPVVKAAAAMMLACPAETDSTVSSGQHRGQGSQAQKDEERRTRCQREREEEQGGVARSNWGLRTRRRGG